MIEFLNASAKKVPIIDDTCLHNKEVKVGRPCSGSIHQDCVKGISMFIRQEENKRSHYFWNDKGILLIGRLETNRHSTENIRNSELH